ncbi:hypothetical protein NTCA1_09200 [Novosphingobium sp. TCA1]|nr:hypothetical protein NTCA1_09200 [Novosphingobium sp. TCA1]
MLGNAAFEVIGMADVVGAVPAAQNVSVERHRAIGLALRAGFDKLSLSGVGLKPGKGGLAR